ncbi:MAG: glutamate--tRNA ligase [Peptococcaceae bacterium]|nr:glutamate--tRNA ligase [Peptococcaceae bacterium]
MSSVRVRFAPSPTGPLHIGGARSALFNWLFARHHGGTFIVRVEDTDQERSSRQSEENIMNALHWLGLDWDEGVDVGGQYGPYRQTERLELYNKYADFLLNSKDAYLCYCSEEELAAEREALMAKGELPRYVGRCRDLTAKERAEFEAAGRRPVVRFRVPENGEVLIKDLVRGDVSFKCDEIGDYIIIKSDGIPTYNFAVVVDDHAMRISHVVRAEEHLSNTPRQILLYNALGWETPIFAHVSLILGKDRSKMSKRHGATSIEQYQNRGYLPEALANFLALLGWSPGSEEEIFSLEQLKQQFSLDRVAKSPAVFDLDKLNWLNGHYIRETSLDRVTEMALPYLEAAGYISTPLAPEEYGSVKMMVAAVRKYLSYMQEITEHVRIFFDDDVQVKDNESGQIMNGDQVKTLMRELIKRINIATTNAIAGDEAKVLLKEVGRSLKLKGKQIFMPVRVALTGSTQGPDLDLVMAILGREAITRRLSKWI